jgi:predicted nucleotidyltransferase
MDKSEAIKIAQEYALLIKKTYRNAKVILFGSYVKGSFHNESDIDIAIILNNYDNILNIQLDLMRLRRKIDSRIEPHALKFSDFNNSNPLAIEIKKYGLIV